MIQDASRKDLSVVVAAYNEEAVIAENVGRILATLHERPDVKWELILINDGSTDGTGSLLDLAMKQNSHIKVIHLWRNYGQGKALRTGFEAAKGDVIITLDADLSYAPGNIWKLYDALLWEKVEICLVSPFTKGGAIKNVPLYRRLLSWWGNRYLSLMSSYRVSALTCVVRAYRREIFDMMYLTSDGMELQAEILMKASMLNLRVAEIVGELVWPEAKRDAHATQRVSKMKVWNAIKLYLQLGWISRPAFLFVVLSIFFILAGMYIAGWLIYNTLVTFNHYWHLGSPFNWALSYSLRDVFAEFTYSFAIGAALIIVGLLIFLFSLNFMQNKFYFEELSKLSQHAITRINQLEKMIYK